MSPTTPIPHDIPLPMPAPEPLLVAVLIVFFLMHIVFVNLMVGGALMSLYYELRGLKEKRYDRLAYEIAATITANKSIAVVLGVGPLLAINTLYTVYFYTANALTGAFWIAIVPLVIVAFVLTYVHKYLWHQMKRVRWLHIAVAAAACLLFLFIPLIFLTNVNLMLFPDKWGSVQGFFSALALPNVLPRYAHFILACPAMTGLLLVWLFRRRPEAEIAEMGFSRAELVRLGYRWAFWPTMAQFIVGPIAFFTLPHVASPIGGVIAAFGLSFLLAFALCVVMIREIRGPDGSIGRRFGTTCALMLAVVALMGVGRHLYREAAVAPHRAQVEAKTKDYIRRADEARRAAQARDGAPASVRP